MQQQLLKKNGFGLLEVLLTIAVAGIITIISVGYYTSVRNEQKVNEFINQLVTLSHNVSTYVNANANNPANQDLTKVFGDGTTSVSQNLINAGIVQPGVIANLWNPLGCASTYIYGCYSIFITMGGQVGNSSSCLSIGVYAENVLTHENANFLSLLQTKVQNALQHPPLNDTQVSGAGGGNITVSFCAE